MQVHGHDIMEYSGAGSGVFMSKLFHRSVYMKMVNENYFFCKL